MVTKKKKAKKKKQPTAKTKPKKSIKSETVKIPLLNSRFHETDYIGASLQDICDDLKSHRKATDAVIQALNTYRTEVSQSKDKIDHYKGVLLYVDNFNETYCRFLSVFDRLLLEIPEGLNENHIYLLKKLFDANDASDARFRLIDSCKNFKSDYISVHLRDESIRPLFDKIYEDSIGVVYFYGGFSAAIPHLKTYIGAKLKIKESAEEAGKKEVKKSGSISIKKDVKSNGELAIELQGESILVYSKNNPAKIQFLRSKKEVFGRAEKLWKLFKKFIEKKGIVYADEESITKEKIHKLNKKLSQYYGLPENRPIKKYVFRNGKDKVVEHGFFTIKKDERLYYKSTIKLHSTASNKTEHSDSKKRESPAINPQYKTGKVDTKFDVEK